MPPMKSLVDWKRQYRVLTLGLLAVWLLSSQLPGAAQVQQGPANVPQPAPAAPQESILVYIKNAWNTLGRSMNECSSIVDPKFGAGAEVVLYLPHDGPVPPAVE